MGEMTIDSWQDAEAPEKQGLKLSGSVTIREAAVFREALLHGLESASELQMDLCDVTGIDLTGLQLLCASHQSALAGGKRFSINYGSNSAYLDTVSNAGFHRHLGCSRDNASSCIWIGGKCQ